MREEVLTQDFLHGCQERRQNASVRLYLHGSLQASRQVDSVQ